MALGRARIAVKKRAVACTLIPDTSSLPCDDVFAAVNAGAVPALWAKVLAEPWKTGIMRLARIDCEKLSAARTALFAALRDLHIGLRHCTLLRRASANLMAGDVITLAVALVDGDFLPAFDKFVMVSARMAVDLSRLLTLVDGLAIDLRRLNEVRSTTVCSCIVSGVTAPGCLPYFDAAPSTGSSSSSCQPVERITPDIPLAVGGDLRLSAPRPAGAQAPDRSSFPPPSSCSANPEHVAVQHAGSSQMGMVNSAVGINDPPHGLPFDCAVADCLAIPHSVIRGLRAVPCVAAAAVTANCTSESRAQVTLPDARVGAPANTRSSACVFKAPQLLGVVPDCSSTSLFLQPPCATRNGGPHSAARRIANRTVWVVHGHCRHFNVEQIADRLRDANVCIYACTALRKVGALVHNSFRFEVDSVSDEQLRILVQTRFFAGERLFFRQWRPLPLRQASAAAPALAAPRSLAHAPATAAGSPRSFFSTQLGTSSALFSSVVTGRCCSANRVEKAGGVQRTSTRPSSSDATCGECVVVPRQSPVCSATSDDLAERFMALFGELSLRLSPAPCLYSGAISPAPVR